MIVSEGVNDMASGTGAASLITLYKQHIVKAYAHNLFIYGVTITPFGGNGYYTTAHEAVRQTVNAWIRTNHLYDAVVDFDAVVCDPVTLTNLHSAYDSGDGLHLNPAGHHAMANAIDLIVYALNP